MLASLRTEQQKLADQHGKRVPMAVKIAPDMADDDIRAVADSFIKHGIDAVIATNTTVSREAVQGQRYADEAGGLSGPPVRDASTKVIRVLAEHMQGAMPIIGVGGISDTASAAEKIKAGASLLQVYTGFIYRGPGLIKDAVRGYRHVKGS